MKTEVTRILFIKTILLMLFVLPSCTDDIDTGRLYFIGDSLIARWDLQESFPSWVTENDGVSGAGIDYIERSAGRYSGDDVVVLVGTNDLASIDDGDLGGYAARYMNAVNALGGRHVYLISVLPRRFHGDRPGLNATIVRFNSLIKEAVRDVPAVTYIDAYYDFCRDGTLDMDYSLDGLHLNVYGYEVLAKCVLNNL